jgi:hypothetical protein
MKDFNHERDEIVQNLAEVERLILKNLSNFTDKFYLQVLTEVGLNIILLGPRGQHQKSVPLG